MALASLSGTVGSLGWLTIVSWCSTLALVTGQRASGSEIGVSCGQGVRLRMLDGRTSRHSGVVGRKDVGCSSNHGADCCGGHVDRFGSR